LISLATLILQSRFLACHSIEYELLWEEIMTHLLSFVRRYLWSVLIPFGLPLIAIALLLAPAASARSVAELPQPVSASCFASLGITTEYFSADATAVQQAIDAASPGDLVKVAGTCAGVQVRSGTTQPAIITKVLTVQGGYTSSNWITSNLAINPTILDAQNAGRVINASTALSLSNLIIQHGRTTTSVGGGLYAGGTLLVSGTQFLSNSAVSGGGLFALDAVNVVSSQFTSNMASNEGGGADFEGTASLTGTTFTRNSANNTAGGVYIFGQASVTNSIFALNTAVNVGGGARFDDVANVAASTFTSNTAILFDGGGAYFDKASSVADSTFISNTANLEGGGAYFNAAASLTATNFIRNSTKRHGGGVYIFGSASITASIFALNTATNTGGGAKFDGMTSVAASTFTSNTAILFDGGGAYFDKASSVADSTFVSNTANLEGGGAYFNAAASLTATAFIRNMAKRSGGGVYIFGAASVTASNFTRNSAAINGGGAKLDGVTNMVASTFNSNIANKGGGLYFDGGGATSDSFVNLLYGGNSAMQGAAIYAANLDGDDSLAIQQATIASPTLGSGSAIYVLNGSVNLTNTLIANYSLGLDRTAGTVREDFTLFSNVTKPYSGTVLSGGHSLTGTAGFVNAASNDYHLSVGSAGIDRGADAGVFTDLDGQVRPANLGFDIGAYEYQGAIFRIFLPLALKNF
jgi:hypothetical protein